MGDLYVKHKKKELAQEKNFLPDHPLKIEVILHQSTEEESRKLWCLKKILKSSILDTVISLIALEN